MEVSPHIYEKISRQTDQVLTEIVDSQAETANWEVRLGVRSYTLQVNGVN